MIELLTIRQANGWVLHTDSPAAPVTVRVRAGETVLVQLTLESPLPSLAQFEETKARRTFSLDFPRLLEAAELPGLIFEAATPGNGHWHVLPRQLRVGDGGRNLLPAGVQDWKPQKMGEIKPPVVPFWSDDPNVDALPAEQHRPVFVLGAVRSGTTAFCLALRSGTRYRGFAEGHVLDVSSRLVNGILAHFDWKDPWIPPGICAGYHLGHLGFSRFLNGVTQMVRSLAAGYRTPYWFDKTPTLQMVASVPLLALAWPNARFVFMKRRGLENLRSRERKFATKNFPGKCRDWAFIMSAWRSVRAAVAGKYLELDQRTMVVDPAGTAAAVGCLLGLDAVEIEAFSGILRDERPESTGDASSIVSGIAELEWTEEQIAAFQQYCSEEMAAYGYTYDERYCS